MLLNAQPSPLLNTKLKHPNALVPTRLAYVGDQVEYVTDMGPEVRILDMTCCSPNNGVLVRNKTDGRARRIRNPFYGHIRRCGV